jgi:hypothetical protein
MRDRTLPEPARRATQSGSSPSLISIWSSTATFISNPLWQKVWRRQKIMQLQFDLNVFLLHHFAVRPKTTFRVGNRKIGQWKCTNELRLAARV